MNAITIQNVELPVVEIEGQRVVTLSMVDKVHQRPEGTAGRNFREHRQRFIKIPEKPRPSGRGGRGRLRSSRAL